MKTLIYTASFLPMILTAGIIKEHSFEKSTGGAETKIEDMDFRGHFGDQDLGFIQIIKDASIARTGKTCVSLNLGDLGDKGGSNTHEFGGNYMGARHNITAGSLKKTDTFTVSAWFKNSSKDPVTAKGSANVHFEFWDATGPIFRTDSFKLCPKTDSKLSQTKWTQLTHTFKTGDAIGKYNDATYSTITESDLAKVLSVRAIITGDNENNTGSGTVLVDDFSFSKKD